MIKGFKDDRRRVIPIWRDYKTTLKLGELSINKKNKIESTVISNAFLTEKVHDWKKNRKMPYASELVCAAITTNQLDIATDAAQYILGNKEQASGMLVKLAERVLGNNEDNGICNDNCACNLDKNLRYKRISYLKGLINIYPRNSILWMDLAREYVILGLNDKALKAVNAAFSLAPDNRYILRAASRFFIHNDDIGRAHEILRKSPNIKYDPWIMASEIAIANVMNRSSNYIKFGREIISSGRYEKFEITELTSALGTLEFDNGDIKAAKKLFQKSIEMPNDNSAAQAVWVSKWLNIPGSDGLDMLTELPCAYEAKAVSCYKQSDWDTALEEAENWVNDQPFASRPIIFASFIASTIKEDYGKSVKILKNGLISNPKDNFIKNNLAYAYVNMGEIEKAEEIFKTFVCSEDITEQILWNATNGLILFRKGDIENGRKLYKKAIDIASKNKNCSYYKAAASIFLAKEEIRAKTNKIGEAFELAVKNTKNIDDYNDVAINYLFNKLDKEFPSP